MLDALEEQFDLLPPNSFDDSGVWLKNVSLLNTKFQEEVGGFDPRTYGHRNFVSLFEKVPHLRREFELRKESGGEQRMRRRRTAGTTAAASGEKRRRSEDECTGADAAVCPFPPMTP